MDLLKRASNASIKDNLLDAESRNINSIRIRMEKKAVKTWIFLPFLIFNDSRHMGQGQTFRKR